MTAKEITQTTAPGADPSQNRRLIPLNRWSHFHPYPSEKQLRWLTFINKDDFAQCIRKIGKRVLIDEAEYFRWVDRINGK